MSLSQPLGQLLTPKKSHLVPALLLVLGIIVALGAAAYGYIESRRTERIVIAVRPIPYGQQITADDLGTVELPLHRPIQLAGMGNPDLVMGRWAAREIGANDLLQPAMLLNTAPDQPVYPSGVKLDKDTVPVPFSIATIGPLTERDVVNIGYNAQTGDPALCRPATEGGMPASAEGGPASSEVHGRPFACRLLQRVKVLYVDDGKGVAYLQMTPYQAHTVWALQAAGVQLWGERYGATSDELPVMDRLDASQIAPDRLTLSLTDTLKLYRPEGMGGGIPGAESAIPGDARPAASVSPTPTAEPQVRP